MKQILITFISIISLMSTTVTSVSFAQGLSPKREFRGAWVATVANISWPSKKGLPTETQKAELIKTLDVATSMNLNAIIFQVRPEGDAFYDSNLEPWSAWLTGEQGKAPVPYYDPLKFAVEECHKRGLEIHAWFNPYRAAINMASKQSPKHFARTHPDMVYPYGRLLWMDPGIPEVFDHTLNVIMDVVRRYDIDGVHFDDYFYPYPEKDTPFPDQKSYATYTTSGGTLGLNDWRRDNVNRMVQAVSNGINKEKPWVKFGNSPFGIWQPGNPEGIEGLNSYTALYADSRKWLQEGWVDYLTPQLYWRIAQAKQSYPRLLNWWMKQNPMGRHIYAGNIVSSVGTGERSWPVSEVLEQIKTTRQEGAQGNIFFDFKVFLRNPAGLDDQLKSGVYSSPVLAPVMSWKKGTIPTKPSSLDVTLIDETKVILHWPATQDLNTWQWAVYKKSGEGNWKLIRVQPASLNSFTDSYSGVSKQKISYAITAVDRLSNESEMTEAALRD